MEDNQKIYLDKVVEFLVRDTIINYDKDEIQFPFLFSSSIFPIFFPFLIPPSLSFHPSFPKYCKDTYGLTEKEVEYVWNQYKDIITDKIENGK